MRSHVASAFTLFGLLLVTLAGCAPSQQANGGRTASTEQALPIPPDLAADVQRSITVGRALYLQDKVSAIGTDVLFAKGGDPAAQGLGGYLTLQDGDETGRPLPTWSVFFFTRDEPPMIAHRIHVAIEPGKAPQDEAFSPPQPASPTITALIRARQAAIAAVHPTEQPINPAVLPGAAIGQDGILVYLLAGTSRPKVAVLGKHYRVLVSNDGATVKSVEALSKSVLELATAAPNGGTMEALVVTHIVTDYPLETHVLVSMQHQLPLYVGTRRGIWDVNRDQIRFVSGPPK
jgi:hypothetical protein